jgi:hypothetical protein
MNAPLCCYAKIYPDFTQHRIHSQWLILEHDVFSNLTLIAFNYKVSNKQEVTHFWTNQA